VRSFAEQWQRMTIGMGKCCCAHASNFAQFAHKVAIRDLEVVTEFLKHTSIVTHDFTFIAKRLVWRGAPRSVADDNVSGLEEKIPFSNSVGRSWVTRLRVSSSKRSIVSGDRIASCEIMFACCCVAIRRITCTLAFAVVGGSFVFAQSPFIGRWKLDSSRSQISGDTITFTADPSGGITFTAEGHSYTFQVDGQPAKDYSGADVVWRQVNANTWRSHAKRNGISLAKATYSLSADSKTLTVEIKGTHQDGSLFDNKSTYQRTTGQGGLIGSWRSTQASAQDSMILDLQSDGEDGLFWRIPSLKSSAHVKMDSHDYAVTGPTAPQGFTMALTSTGSNSLKVIEKMKGVPILQIEYRVSPDGTTMIDTGSTAKGNEPFREIWKRQ